MDGRMTKTFQISGKRTFSLGKDGLLVSILGGRNFLEKKLYSISGKERNKIQKKYKWKWNNKMWVTGTQVPSIGTGKRIDIEALLLETSLDLLFVSEANLFESTPEWEREVEGYKMLLPPSMKSDGYSRIVLLYKEGLNVNILPEYMENDLAAIWVRIGRKSTKPLHIGGLYRQHKLPFQGEMSREELLTAQRERWGG